MARDRILARIAGDQRITLQDIGPAQDERGTFGAFAIVGWPRPVTLRDFAWPRLGGCQDGRPFRGSRRVRVPLVSDLSQAAVTIDLRLGRVVVIQSGPDQLGAASPSTAPTPLTPGPEGLVLGPNDFSIAHVVSTTSSFGSFVEEGMSQSLFCALGPVGRIAGHGVVLRPADGSPGLVVSAVIVTESPAAARRLVRLARPLARFMDIRPRAIAAPRQVGDHADAYVATALSAEGRPSGPAVVWTHGRLVGAVFQTGAGAAALDALLGLADAQEARMAAAAG
jgi:hypothetical protein